MQNSILQQHSRAVLHASGRLNTSLHSYMCLRTVNLAQE